ncbi:MAG: CarD family transcriptional regulator [Bacillota bacterium]|nr:CarD family transcriptional regulator [Bacillota bacterium]MDW7730401.1 CarD family transcriptional regulator [Bacillota bacterium]
MFSVGDRVVYPMHGAGVIEAIEEKEILGARKKYYVMKLPMGEMKVLIPTDSIIQVGLRGVIEKDKVPQVFVVLQGEQPEMSANWNRRYRNHLEKIKSGDIFEVAEVVRNLMLRDREKGLSTGESKMLETARQILVSELILVQGMEHSEIVGILDDIFVQTPK